MAVTEPYHLSKADALLWPSQPPSAPILPVKYHKPLHHYDNPPETPWLQHQAKEDYSKTGMAQQRPWGRPEPDLLQRLNAA